MDQQKIVLAYSGGLDTTYCLAYLTQLEKMKVHAVTINTGAFSPADIANLETKAIRAGASSFRCIDVRQAFYDTCIKYLVFGNILKNGTYPLSVSAERAVQAAHVARYAR